MQRVFISNAKIQEADNISIDSSDDINNLSVDEKYKNGNFVFIIDVHCTFRESERTQQQGGLVIYRNLLKQFKDCQDKLKVIFYSPISKENLVALAPENYALTLLPFVELFPTDENGTNIPNWNFEFALQNAEKEESPQFNNASENLLSGWAIEGEGKIDVGGKKILFIDDQQIEWKTVFDEIFEKDKLIYVKTRKGEIVSSQKSYRDKMRVDRSKFIEMVKSAINEKPSLILSDFYLEENHDTTKWKNPSEIKSISGFKLFDSIRFDFPAIPYVFHTSSNKASIYKFLDSNGVDDWLIKDVRDHASRDEKLENYKEFKFCILSFLTEDIYERISHIWTKISELKNQNADYYKRFPNKDEAFMKEIVDTYLQHSWIALRRSLNKEITFEENILHTKTTIKDWFVTASILNNLGKIIEYLPPKRPDDRTDWVQVSSLWEIAYQIRNCASHYQDNDMLTLTDVFIIFEIIFDLLENETNLENSTEPRIDLNDKVFDRATTISRPYAVFWIYVLFYNYTRVFRSFCPEIAKRIKEYWQDLEKANRIDRLLDNLNSELNMLVTGSGNNFRLKDENGAFSIERY